MAQAITYLKNFSVIGLIAVVFFVFLMIKEIRELSKYYESILKENIKKQNNDLKESKKVAEHDELIQEIHNKIETLSTEVQDLKAVVDEIRKDNKENKRAELKDRLSQNYRFYRQRARLNDKEVPFWTKMEKESFLDLINSYEKNGGENSFVHETICPDIETWDLVSETIFYNNKIEN